MLEPDRCSATLPAARELELKFALPEGEQAGIQRLAAFAGPGRTETLRSVYFDTPSHDLKREGFSLRVRATDGGFVQTLKQKHEAGGVSRSEWEAPVPDEQLDLAALADTPVKALLKRHRDDLGPVFTTTVERTCHLWADGQDLVEVCLDRGALTAGLSHEPISELELELKAGRPAALFTLARQVVGQSPLPLLFDSKSSRGYRLSTGDASRPTTGRVGCVSPDCDVAGAFRNVVWDCLIQISTSAARIQFGPETEAVHQVRVGLRRLDTAFRLFKPAMADARIAVVSAGADWLSDELERARNLDVFSQTVYQPAAATLAAHAGYVGLGAVLSAARDAAYQRAIAAVRSVRFATWIIDAVALVEDGDWAMTEEPVLRRLLDEDAATFAAQRLDRMNHQVRDRAARFATLNPAERHRLRIRAKRLRYSVEFFAASFGKPDKVQRYIKGLKTIQGELGRLNDLHTAHALAADLTLGQPADVAFAAGLIIGLRERDADALDAAALKALAKFERVRPFWPKPHHF